MIFKVASNANHSMILWMACVTTGKDPSMRRIMSGFCRRKSLMSWKDANGCSMTAGHAWQSPQARPCNATGLRTEQQNFWLLTGVFVGKCVCARWKYTEFSLLKRVLQGGEQQQLGNILEPDVGFILKASCNDLP